VPIFNKQSQLQLAGRLVAALLAAWVFVLTLAGVSPALHKWLHADNNCASHCEHPEGEKSEGNPEHFCGVLTLQSGAVATPALEVPECLSFRRAPLAVGDEVIASKKAGYTHQARAPPVEIIA
jgi:hypothetical protein